MKLRSVGVGLRPIHYDRFLKEKPSTVSWVEVITENFIPGKIGKPNRGLKLLEQVRKDYQVALHGVSLNLGSTDPLNQAYLRKLKSLTDLIQPVFVSDHLAWTGVNGENSHDLLPVPYVRSALALIADKVNRVQGLLGRTILIENPSSYVSFIQSEMSEWDFLNELCQRTKCELLLDINNIYVSSVNHEFDPHTYLKAIPAQSVRQIHLAGHTEQNGILVDTHDAPVCPEVWNLYEWSVRHFGAVPAMIERDSNIPEWHELELELKKIGRTQDAVKSKTAPLATAIL